MQRLQATEETSNLIQKWEAEVHEMQCERQKKNYKTCEAPVAEQKPASRFEATLEEEHPIVEHSHQRVVKSASPPVNDEVSRLSRDIAALRSEHAATITELERRRHENSLLWQKAEQLADANAALRKAQETKDNEKKQVMERLVQTYEAPVEGLQGTAKPVEANTVSRPIQERVTHSVLLSPKSEVSHEQTDYQTTRSDSTQRPGSSVSPRKHIHDEDTFSQTEGVYQPRKRAKVWSME